MEEAQRIRLVDDLTEALVSYEQHLFQRAETFVEQVRMQLFETSADCTGENVWHVSGAYDALKVVPAPASLYVDGQVHGQSLIRAKSCIKEAISLLNKVVTGAQPSLAGAETLTKQGYEKAVIAVDEIKRFATDLGDWKLVDAAGEVLDELRRYG